MLKSGGGSHHHKLDKIKHLLNLFTELNFILIGDSSQQDAEIYSQIAREYPDRILVIYIRDVSGKKKEQLVREMASNLAPHQTELPLVKDTAEAAKDAFQRGFIDESEYQEVKQDVEAAKREPILMPGECFFLSVEKNMPEHVHILPCNRLQV